MTLSLQLSDLLYGHSRPLFAPLNLQCRSGDIWAVLGANGPRQKHSARYPDRGTDADRRWVYLRGRSRHRAAAFSPGFWLAGARRGADGTGAPR